MCGIVGVYGPKASTFDLRKSIELLLKRGPDSHSIAYPNSSLALGAARLAMTDPLPRSNQPFGKNEDWIVFNGEIYNHTELRGWLQDRFGISFSTQSDTEVLLEILRIFGADGIKYLNGMFAFAYFDHSKQKVLIGRDRLGKKPLFFALKDSHLYWASTIEALRKIITTIEVNTNSIFSYLAFGYTIDTSTIYKEIYAVKPGYCYEVQADGFLQSRRSPEFESNFTGKHDDPLLYQQIISSVSDRIENHHNVAISLSGGLDSSIVAQVSSKTDKNIVAYSLKWGDSDKTRYNDDFRKAELIAKNLNLRFVGVDFSSDPGSLESNLREFVRFMGEPNANPTGVSLIPLYRKISEDGFRLVLTGDGSDEIFGGYPRYESPLLQNNFRFLTDSQIFKLAFRNALLSKLSLRFAKPSSPGIWANFHWNFNPVEIARLFTFTQGMSSKEIARDVFASIENLDLEGPTGEVNQALVKVMERDRTIWLTNESNRKLDRISMAFSIEARSPFQDERVIEMARQILLKRNFQSQDKEYLRNLFPELRSVGVRNDKAGFISPVGHWLRTNPILVQTGLDALANTGLFEINEIDKRRRDQFSGDYQKLRQLWSLVVLGYWYLQSWER